VRQDTRRAGKGDVTNPAIRAEGSDAKEGGKHVGHCWDVSNNGKKYNDQRLKRENGAARTKLVQANS
jgi:hypothetical protein